MICKKPCKLQNVFSVGFFVLWLSVSSSQVAFGTDFVPDTIDKIFSESLGKTFGWITEQIDKLKADGIKVTETPYQRSAYISDGYTYTWKGKDGLGRQIIWHTRDSSRHLPVASNSSRGAIIKYSVGIWDGGQFFPQFQMVPTEKGSVFISSSGIRGSSLIDDIHIPAAGNKNVPLYLSGSKNHIFRGFGGRIVPISGLVIGTLLGVFSRQKPAEAASETALSWVATTFPPVGLALSATAVASVALVGVQNANQWVQNEHQRMYRETYCMPLWDSFYRVRYCLSRTQKEDFLRECTLHQLSRKSRKSLEPLQLKLKPIAPQIFKYAGNQLNEFVKSYHRQLDSDQRGDLSSYLNKLIGEKAERDRFFTDFASTGASNFNALSQDMECACKMGLERDLCHAGVFNFDIWFIDVLKKLLKQAKEDPSSPKPDQQPQKTLPTTRTLVGDDPNAGLAK